MNDKMVNKVLVSCDYDKFRKLSGNREVNDRRLSIITKSIRDHGYIQNPIIVNQNYEIIDGQGRFEACKNLGLPIVYTIVKDIGINECIAMNINQKNWSTKDYIKSFARAGYEDYVILNNVICKYGGKTKKWEIRKPGTVPEQVICNLANMCMSEGSSQTNADIKRGKFTIYNKEKFEDKVVFCAKVFDEMSKMPEMCGRAMLWAPAINFIFDYDGISNDKFLHQLHKNIHRLTGTSNVAGAYNSFTKVYNCNLSERNRIDIYDEMRYMQREMKAKKKNLVQ